MAHTHICLPCHLIFSTKERRPLLRVGRFDRLAAIFGGILKDHNSKLLAMNGTDNHVHLLTSLRLRSAIPDQIRDVKALSSKWINETYKDQFGFAWQTGYSLFAVSKSVQPAVEEYIAGQAEHHRKRTFEEELIAILELHGVEYDPRFVFD